MIFRLVGMLFLSLVLSPVFGQTGKSDFGLKFTEANQLMEEKQWNSAIAIWNELLQSDTYNANINYKIGCCYMETATEKLKSLPHLKAAISEGVVFDYEPYMASEKRAPVEAMYVLGRAYHLNSELDLAIKTFQELKSMLPPKHHMRKQCERQMDMCEEAKKQIADPKPFIINNLGPVVNTNANEYSPVISIDESALFFTARKLRADSSNVLLTDSDTGELREDIYVSYKDQSGNWMSPERLNIDNDDHSATISVSPDGQTLYIYYDEEGNGQIYQSVLIGETWSDPELLGSDINSDAWETHVTVSADGSLLYFVSDREKGYGGRDIYRCVKLPDGQWSKALPLGPVINTQYEEDSPFLSPDGKTLYFSSTGHNSIGGFDIFYCMLGEDGEWTTPVNMGYPLNTVDDDVFFVPTADGRRAYYSSRKEEGYGLKDIYVLELPEPMVTDLSVLKGYIFPPEGEVLPDDTYVLLTNQSSAEVTEYRPRKRDGAYVAILSPCVAYSIEYVVEGKIVHQELINVPCESAYNEIEKEIYLLPLYLGGKKVYDVEIAEPEPEPVAQNADAPSSMGEAYDPNEPIKAVYLEDVGVALYERYFVYDFHEFGTGEEHFLDFVSNVEKILKAKGTVEIFIESSASQVPSARFKTNQDLSNYRAETCKKQILEILLKKGFTEDQFVFLPPKSLVGGPKFKGDAIKNRLVYEQYQYIKARAK